MGRAARGSRGENRAAAAGLPRLAGAQLPADGEAVALTGLSAVLFDWDGTLVDSAEASFRCYTRLFAGYAIAFDRSVFEATYSPDWHRTYRLVGLPPDRWGEADARWLAHYDEEETRLLPGAAEAITRLAEEGLALGIVTSGSRPRVVREVERFGLAPRFAGLVCAEDTVRRKPHPEPLHVGLERLGVAASEAACVGDSPEDVEMARAAGVLSVGVPGGFPNREALRGASPDLWAHELSDAVGQLLARRGTTPSAR
ncbi:MAG TPA: HAD family hydrolase [Thermoanaerobaculia bacterium]|nr:HAD family hydrolase [Thermoanaerobaculia bacterium]